MTEAVNSIILSIAELVARSIELVAIVIIAVAVIGGLIGYLGQAIAMRSFEGLPFNTYRRVLARALLLALELLVAADVVSTVVLEPSLENAAVLGLLVIIRTFLGWSLVVELEGRWPWRRSSAEASDGIGLTETPNRPGTT